MQTLDQIRAKFAWESVSTVSNDLREKYRKLAKGLPSMVMSNGLMQTLAYLEGKGKGEHQQLQDNIREWLIDPKVNVLPVNATNFATTMTELMKMDTLGYQRATEETMAILRWIRQLADTVK